ncbi:transposase [Asticcacaulis sp. EMRT-3]|uniref:transposase n=1 Tax=Asticcacaulis sp. EMRT-3 TaxID=3040349 RepID=UPI0024AFFF1C|nr:transposase [Asticcacaulis sp. EMRT-3]MDI7774322.1 transposase [Asticcacaulis sp. EMRT-3]
MARLGRMIIPEVAHHVTQRGNRRERIFLEPGDEQIYLDLMATQLKRYNVACLVYCLMPNHVHFILTPIDETGLARAVGEAHRRYTGFIGARQRWTGHLFQGRFGSVAMDEAHLLAAFRYVALNPVKARLVERAQDWPWSSAAAHIQGQDTAYVQVEPALSRIPDFAEFVRSAPVDDECWSRLLQAEQIGRPIGAKAWIEQLEAVHGRALLPQKRGPKPRRIKSPEQKPLPLFT